MKVACIDRCIFNAYPIHFLVRPPPPLKLIFRILSTEAGLRAYVFSSNTRPGENRTGRSVRSILYTVVFRGAEVIEKLCASTSLLPTPALPKKKKKKKKEKQTRGKENKTKWGKYVHTEVLRCKYRQQYLKPSALCGSSHDCLFVRIFVLPFLSLSALVCCILISRATMRSGGQERRLYDKYLDMSLARTWRGPNRYEINISMYMWNHQTQNQPPLPPGPQGTPLPSKKKKKKKGREKERKMTATKMSVSRALVFLFSSNFVENPPEAVPQA